MPAIDRRRFLGAGAASLGAFGLLRPAPAWARGAISGTLARRGSDVLSGEHLTMTVATAKNRIYLGQTIHKGRAWPGEHEAIVVPSFGRGSASSSRRAGSIVSPVAVPAKPACLPGSCSTATAGG